VRLLGWRTLVRVIDQTRDSAGRPDPELALRIFGDRRNHGAWEPVIFAIVREAITIKSAQPTCCPKPDVSFPVLKDGADNAVSQSVFRRCNDVPETAGQRSARPIATERMSTTAQHG